MDILASVTLHTTIALALQSFTKETGKVIKTIDVKTMSSVAYSRSGEIYIVECKE